MPQILFTFLIIVGLLSAIVVGTGEIVARKEEVDIDSQYYNADGDHIYYERSLIEKKSFRKRYPNIRVRRFLGLFGC